MTIINHTTNTYSKLELHPLYSRDDTRFNKFTDIFCDIHGTALININQQQSEFFTTNPESIVTALAVFLQSICNKFQGQITRCMTKFVVYFYLNQ